MSGYRRRDERSWPAAADSGYGPACPRSWADRQPPTSR